MSFSPFGVDDREITTGAEISERLTPFAQEYAMVAPMMRELAQWSFDGKIKAVVEHEDFEGQTIDLGAWKAMVIRRQWERECCTHKCKANRENDDRAIGRK